MSYLEISSEQLHSLLILDADKGHLYWRSRPASMFRDDARFTAEWRCKCWNTRHAGKRALAALNGDGYPCGTLLNYRLTAHRVIFCMIHGRWPTLTDHIDGHQRNNSKSNLRDVKSDAGNAKNRRLKRTNNSGAIGVSFEKTTGSWRVRVGRDHIGLFKNFAEAVAAQKAASVLRGYHPNHGRKI